MPGDDTDDLRLDLVGEGTEEELKLKEEEAEKARQAEEEEKERLKKEGEADAGSLEEVEGVIVPETELNDEQASALATANYQLLVEKGILPEGLEVKSFDDLSNHINDLKLAGINEFRAELPKDIDSTIDAWSKGIDYNKSKERRQQISQFKNITDDMLKEENVALSIIKAYHKQLGDSDDYIKDRIDNIIDNDRTVLEAKRARAAMVKVQEANAKLVEEAEIQKKAVETEKYNTYREDVEDKIKNSDIFWGKKLSAVDQQSVVDAIFNPQAMKAKNKDFKTLEEAIQEDPTIYAQLQYIYLKKMLGKKGSLKFISNAVKSQAVGDIENVLKGTTVKSLSNKSDDSENDYKGLGFMDTIKQNLRP